MFEMYQRGVLTKHRITSKVVFSLLNLNPHMFDIRILKKKLHVRLNHV